MNHASEHERSIHAFYKFVPEVSVRSRLGMEASVQAWVDVHFKEEWQKM